VTVSNAQAKALQAATDGALRRWNEATGFRAGGKTYIIGLGPVQKPTIDALLNADPPLLAEGAKGERWTQLVITPAGFAALAEHATAAARHVGKARRS